MSDISEFKQMLRKVIDQTEDLTELGFEFPPEYEPPAASSSTTDLKDAMVAYGVITNGGATNLNLDGGDITCDDITCDDITADDVSIDVLTVNTINAGTINFTGNIDGSATSDIFAQDVQVEGLLKHTGSQLVFFNGTPVSKQTVSGVTDGTLAQLQAAFRSLMDALAIGYNMVTDSTTP